VSKGASIAHLRYYIRLTVGGGSSLFQVGLVIKWMWSRRGGLTGGVIVSLAA
jgi:hypothetical protein